MKWLIGSTILIVIVIVIVAHFHASLPVPLQPISNAANNAVTKAQTGSISLLDKLTGSNTPDIWHPATGLNIPVKSINAKDYYGNSSNDPRVLWAINNGILTPPPGNGNYFVDKQNPPYTQTNWNTTNPLIA